MLKAESFQTRVAALLAVTPDLAVPAIGTDAKPEEEKPEAPVAMTTAEKAAATRKRRQAAATVH